MLDSFGDYLKKRRKKAGLTQDQLAIALSCHSLILSGIDSVTISRWERATTEPGCDRQREVLAYFGDDVEKLYPFRFGRADQIRADRAIDYLVRHYLVSPKLGRKVGTFPDREGGNDFVEKLEQSDFHQHCLDVILEYDDSNYQAVVPISKARLNRWIGRNNSLALVCLKHRQYFGHLVVLPLKAEAFWQLIHARREEAEITVDDIVAAPSEPHSLYVYSLYGSSRMAAGRMIMEMMTYIGRHFDSIHSIGGLCTTNDGARLARAFHLQPVQTGPVCPKGQIRYHGREVKFVTYANRLAHILADSGLRKLLPV